MSKNKKAVDEPKKMGRPSLYKEEYCEQLIDHMRTGGSFEAFAGVLEVATETLYEWTRVHPEFSEAHKKGKGLAFLHFERLALDNITETKNSGFNYPVWMFFMKCRFGWRDREPTQVTQVQQAKESAGDDSTVKELQRQIEELKKINGSFEKRKE